MQAHPPDGPLPAMAHVGNMMVQLDFSERHMTTVWRLRRGQPLLPGLRASLLLDADSAAWWVTTSPSLRLILGQRTSPHLRSRPLRREAAPKDTSSRKYHFFPPQDIPGQTSQLQRSTWAGLRFLLQLRCPVISPSAQSYVPHSLTDVFTAHSQPRIFSLGTLTCDS